MRIIDLNADIGEAFGTYRSTVDTALLPFVTSVNIACGFHAGDPAVMRQTVSAAVREGVAIGAHPGLPDLQGFGRREIRITASEAYELTLYQTGALYGFVKAAGATLHHVKPHGALYNMAATNEELAQAIVQAIQDFDPSLILYGQAGSALIRAAGQVGIRAASEVFADRTYQDDGFLTSRSDKHALIEDPRQAAAQALYIATHQRVISATGKTIPLKAETICLHGDQPGAAASARLINSLLKQNGLILKAPGK